MQKLPWLHVPELEPVALALAGRSAVEDECDETTRRFVQPFSCATDRRQRVRDQLSNGGELDRLVNEHANLDAEGLQFLDEEIGAYPMSYPERADAGDRIEDLWTRPIGDVIDELIEEKGGFVGHRQPHVCR